MTDPFLDALKGKPQGNNPIFPKHVGVLLVSLQTIATRVPSKNSRLTVTQSFQEPGPIVSTVPSVRIIQILLGWPRIIKSYVVPTTRLP